MKRQPLSVLFTTVVLAIGASGWLVLARTPAHAQFPGGAIPPATGRGPTSVTVEEMTAGEATTAASDGKGNVVVTYTGGLIAVVTPQTGNIRTFRVYQDGTVDKQVPLKFRTRQVPATAPLGAPGSFPGGGGGFGGASR